MEIRLEEMREIAKTLPIGYYLGRKVPVMVEPGDGAYCDVVKGDIHIGIELLQLAAAQIDAKDAAEWSREKLLRCLLYHEVGHLLLTPKWLKHGVEILTAKRSRNPDSDTLVNIFEDERLEQVLASTFIGVDFKGFVRLIHKSGCNGTQTGKFLKAVRLRQTTQDISSAVDDAIRTLKSITSFTSCWDEIDDVLSMELYRKVVQDLVNKIITEGDKQQQRPQQGGADGKQSEKDESEQGQQQDEPEHDESNSEDGESDDENETEDDNPSKQADPEEEQPDDTDDEKQEAGSGTCDPGKIDMPENHLKNIAEKIFVTPTADVTNTLNRFAVRLSKRKGAQAAGCWSALHGRIDIKRDALDKERIFRRRSDVGDRLNSAVNLVLWVDRSGSFIGSQDTLNQILAATGKALNITGGKLTVSVVKMGNEAKVAKPSDWRIEANGGNSINGSYLEAWRATRKKDRRNIDIIVFDGACDIAVDRAAMYTNLMKRKKEAEERGLKLRVRGGAKNLKKNASAAMADIERIVKMCDGWNHPDCHIISDPSNAPLFDRMTRAHVTYVDGDYAERLQAEVIKTLDRIL